MTSPRKILCIANILVEKGCRVGQEVTYPKVRTVEHTLDGKTYAVKIVDKVIARQDYLHKFKPRELLLKLKPENVVTMYEIIRSETLFFTSCNTQKEAICYRLSELEDCLQRKGPKTRSLMYVREFNTCITKTSPTGI